MRGRQQSDLGCPGGGCTGMVPGGSSAALPAGPRSPSRPGRTCCITPRPGPAAAPVIFAFAQHDLGLSQGMQARRAKRPGKCHQPAGPCARRTHHAAMRMPPGAEPGLDVPCAAHKA